MPAMLTLVALLIRCPGGGEVTVASRSLQALQDFFSTWYGPRRTNFQQVMTGFVAVSLFAGSFDSASFELRILEDGAEQIRYGRDQGAEAGGQVRRDDAGIRRKALEERNSFGFF